MMSALTSNLAIRPATLADAEMLTQLAARTFYDAFAPTNTPENMRAYISTAFTLAQTQAELNDPLSAFLIAESATQPCGYAKLYRGPAPECVTGAKPIELARLYVEQHALGAGVGAALLQACFATAHAEGCETIFLGVWEHNERAKAFYQKWGFRRVGEHIFQMGDDPQLDWWLARSLAE
jgi:ribosomal protein S18 acetylase RimI-like enzyme